MCRQYVPAAAVTPDRIGLTITIVNQLDRVFRSVGSVISLNIDGKTIAFDQSGIKEFLDVIVLPRGQAQVTVWGPPISVLRNSGTVALFVFDVVTAVDAVGTPTKKQNYEWYYTYTIDSQSDVVPMRYDKVRIDRSGQVSATSFGLCNSNYF